MALRADDVDITRDRALVRRFQAGDDAAFDELYRRYHDRLERFCLRRTGDRHAAEELAQEAFTRALTALPELGGDLRFYPWVSVIAARLCIDHLRRQARSEPCPDPYPGPVSGGQEEGMVDAVDASLAAAALARLVPRHRDVLRLREVEGWTYQGIADHYGVPIGTVETLLFRARRALRREFRLVEGVGLAAIPLLRRLAALGGRARARLPAWVPPAPSLSAVAAAATATVAVVAITMAPHPPPVAGTAPAPMHQPPVAHPLSAAAAHAAMPALAGARGAPLTPAWSPGAGAPIALGDATATSGPAATSTTTAVSAPAITPVTVDSGSAPGSPTTTTNAVTGGGTAAVGSLLDSAAAPLVTVPPASAITSALPPVSLPETGALLPPPPASIGPVLPEVRGLLPGG